MMIHLVAVCLLAIGGSGIESATPNVVVFFADDLGSADLGFRGVTDIDTPQIDALAETGVRFTNFYVSAPVCSPSRAALLTGRNHHRAGVPGNVSSAPGRTGMPTDEITFAELVKPLGYRTALIGKWHLGTTAATLPNGQGFDEFFGFQSGCINYYTHIFTFNEPKRHDLWRNDREVHEDGKYFTELVTREATAFLERSKDQPFLLYVPYNAPHYPMQAPARWFERYRKLSADRQAYAALVSAMDESIGKIMAKIESLELRERTLVFFLSDHGATIEKRAGGGGGSNVPFRGFKFSLFDGGIRSPLVVSWPGTIPQGLERDQLAISTDIFPTIAEAVGAARSDDRKLDGHSLLPIVQKDAPSAHETLFWQLGPDKAVRRGTWKLVVDAPLRGKKPEILTWLSDLSVDSGETTNLAAQHPEIVRELLDAHEQWMAEVGRDQSSR